MSTKKPTGRQRPAGSQPAERPLTKKAQRFADAMGEPDTPSGTQAAKDAGYDPKSAHVTASLLLKNPKVKDRIEKRKAEVAQYANVLPAQVLGATALRAFATIDDAFNEQGDFDIAKARKTGAIHLIKSIKKTRTKFGDNIAVEFYSNESAQDRLGQYLGLEKLAAENPDTIKQALKAYDLWLERNPHADINQKADAAAIFARGGKVDEAEFAKLAGISQTIETIQ